MTIGNADEPRLAAAKPPHAEAGPGQEPEQDAAARKHALRVLAISSLGVFVVFLDTTIVNVAFETISRSFHTTTDHLAWVLNAYSLVFAAVLIPAAGSPTATAASGSSSSASPASR